MPNNNNIYFNAAFTGFYTGMVAGRQLNSAVQADYDLMRQCAVAMATDVDALIAEDALVSTGGGDPTQLAITTNTIAANEQWRAGCLQAICQSVSKSYYTKNPVIAGAQTALAANCHAMWLEGLTGLVTP